MSANISNWKLPDDIVKVIFSKLPFSNLPNCRIVCKAWNNLVLDYANNFSINKFLFHPNTFFGCTYEFVPDPRMYTCNPKIYCFDFDTTNSVASLGFDEDCKFVEIHSSCNGLLQITKSTKEFDEIAGILNPMTNEFIEVCRSNEDYWFGFGFSPNTKQYKLFRRNRITYDDDEFISTTEVWRFGTTNESQQWKPLPSSQLTFSIESNGVYSDGVIYWIRDDTRNKFVIYGLDVETEEFETVAILDVGFPSLEYKHYSYFRKFNATIYLIIKMSTPILKMQVWIMRAKHSWIKEFVFDISDYHMPFNFIKAEEGGVYFQVDEDLFYFDKSGKKIKIKTLFDPKKTVIISIWQVESFHFDSLSKILGGNN